MRASSLFVRSAPGRAKMCGSSSSTCFFHCVIWVVCTPYSEEISLSVFSPLIASKATLALKSLLYFFGELATDFLLVNALSLLLFYLISLSSFSPPLYKEGGAITCTPFSPCSHLFIYATMDSARVFTITLLAWRGKDHLTLPLSGLAKTCFIERAFTPP